MSQEREHDDPRRRFLRALAGCALAAACTRKSAPIPAGGKGTMTSATPPTRLPVVFIGHGSPMNALEDNAWSRGFKAVGAQLPTAKAILSVSAHWYVGGTYLTAGASPKTIHDFGGFPRELYEMQYPARGDDNLAKRV